MTIRCLQIPFKIYESKARLKALPSSLFPRPAPSSQSYLSHEKSTPYLACSVDFRPLLSLIFLEKAYQITSVTRVPRCLFVFFPTRWTSCVSKSSEGFFFFCLTISLIFDPPNEVPFLRQLRDFAILFCTVLEYPLPAVEPKENHAFFFLLAHPQEGYDRPLATTPFFTLHQRCPRFPVPPSSQPDQKPSEMILDHVPTPFVRSRPLFLSPGRSNS